MSKCINQLLNLQGLLSTNVVIDEVKKQITVNVRSPRRLCKCPSCGQSTKKVHQTSVRKIKHGTVDLKIVILHLKVRRFKCKKCQKVFTERIKCIDKKRATANYRQQLLSWLQTNSFSYIASRYQISPATLVRYLLEINKDISINWKSANITKLGIDEHSFRGKVMVITITDLSNKKLLAVLKGDSKKHLEEFIENIPKKYRDKINEACTDLRTSYKNVIEKCLPQVIHTADRFHVELLCRRLVDDIRTVVQEDGIGRKMNMKKILWSNKDELNEYELKRLAMVFEKYKQYPVLKQAWIIKEQVVRMYRANTEEEAIKRFKHIMMLLETSDYSKYLTTTKNTLKKWKKPILNYFKYRTTNGFTEGCHTKIKSIKRISYGFKNIDNYIAKITLAFLPLSFIINYHTI